MLYVKGRPETAVRRGSENLSLKKMRVPMDLSEVEGWLMPPSPPSGSARLKTLMMRRLAEPAFGF
jgi:hypothetical protein